MDFLHLSLPELIKTLGLLGIVAIIFAESGLLIGFFLPGDSLLFTAGFLASQGFLNVYLLAVFSFIAAVIGDSVGYSFGARVGRKLFEQKESRFFRKDHLLKAEEFYEKHGGKTIILARFMPFIRTFAPIVAGVAKMNYRKFVTYNIVGGFLWSIGLSFAGFFLGKLIPDVDKYLLPIIGLIIIFSVSPTLWHLYRDRRRSKNSLVS